ncbi:MAG: hypothetical protein HYY43_03120 [Deltaproteobacteria bacterium]|nr:hypothetical protein [Deltaproteobacteria bacterium]
MIASMETPTIVGRIIIARTHDAAKIESPGPPRYVRIIGASHITPINP